MTNSEVNLSKLVEPEQDNSLCLPRNRPRLRRQYANTLCGRLGCIENCQHKDTDDEFGNPEVSDESKTPEEHRIFHKIVAHCDCDDCTYMVANCDCDECRDAVEHCDCEHCEKPIMFCTDCRQTRDICNCDNYIDPSDPIISHCNCDDCTYIVAHCNCYQCKYNVEHCDCDQCDKPIVYCIECRQIMNNCVCVENAAKICCGNLGCEDCRTAILCHNVHLNSNCENDNNIIQYNENNIIHYTEIKNNINLNYIDSKENEPYEYTILEMKKDEPDGNLAEMKGDEPDGNLTEMKRDEPYELSEIENEPYVNIAEMKGDESDGNGTFYLSVKPCENSEYELFDRDDRDYDDKFKYTGSEISDCDSECEYCKDRRNYDNRNRR